MNKKFSHGFLFFCFLHILSVFCLAQNLKVNIEVKKSKPSEIIIKGNFSDDSAEKNLLFLLSYADSDNLGSRIENVELFDLNKQKINYRKIADGSYIAEKPFNSFSYLMNAAIPANVLSVAHISWISGEKGILRLNDLLPQFKTAYQTDVSIKIPDGWNLSTTESVTDLDNYSINRSGNTAFIIGRGWHSRTFKVSDAIVNVVLDDIWKFENTVAEKIITDILFKYEDYFGSIPEKKLHIVNFRFPKDVGFERWRAETFGGNILVMSAPTTFESQMRQRFQEQMRHELFHLWMPNNLALDGNYAGFYEGFAQYTALRAGVELNQISFGDFLNTMEQSHNLANRRSQPVSLIEASKNRWLSEHSSVYAKGLAVAFLFDVALLKHRSGKKDLIFLLGEIYKKHKNPNKKEDANSAILNFFESYKELSPIIKDYVEGSEKLNFRKFLPQTGIEIQSDGLNIKLLVKNDLTGREKDFLDKLGYNNWRKFVSK